MPLTPKRLIRLLKRNGFVEIESGKGSHRKFYNYKTKRKVVVPYHNKELKKGTEHAILKDAGLLEDKGENHE